MDHLIELVRYMVNEIHSSFEMSIEDAESIVDDFLKEQETDGDGN